MVVTLFRRAYSKVWKFGQFKKNPTHHEFVPLFILRSLGGSDVLAHPEGKNVESVKQIESILVT